MKHENQVVISERCIRNDEGKLITTEKDQLKTWKDLNHRPRIEFALKLESSVEQEPVQSLARLMLITEDMVSRVINSMINSKAAGPTEIVIEMIGAAGPLAILR